MDVISTNIEVDEQVNSEQEKEHKIKVKQFDIYEADLSPVIGSEQGGTRPVLVVSSNDIHRNSPTCIVVAFTKRTTKARMSTHFFVGKKYGLEEESILITEQIRVLDKSRFKRRIGYLDDIFIQDKIKECIRSCFDLD